MIAAALQKIDESSPLLCPESWKVAELNVEQIDLESGDCGEIGLDQIRVILPASSQLFPLKTLASMPAVVRGQ
jgi:hypothetical protein